MCEPLVNMIVSCCLCVVAESRGGWCGARDADEAAGALRDVHKRQRAVDVGREHPAVAGLEVVGWISQAGPSARVVRVLAVFAAVEATVQRELAGTLCRAADQRRTVVLRAIACAQRCPSQTLAACAG